MAISVEIATEDVTAAVLWKDLHLTQSIGQPDDLSLKVVGFLSDPGITAPVIAAFLNPDAQLITVVRQGSAVLFSGAIRIVEDDKPTKGALERSCKGTGWEFLVPRRLVGVPNGDNWIVQGDGDPDRLPTAVVIDPAAIGQPTAGSVKALWESYWLWPQIDLDTFVADILPVGAPAVDDITWSGSDLAGATGDLAAAGSAAALWWLANDSPNPQSADAPNLALHFGTVVLPDPGENPDDLLMGLPMADVPSIVAPYEIDNDNPNGTTSILPNSIGRSIDHGGRTDGYYVRGATGWSFDDLGFLQEGGTGWTAAGANGASGGRYGEEYLDAPAAITPDQRDAFGNAALGVNVLAKVTYTIRVTGYDGWAKGQAVKVTDADYGLAAAWLLVRSVEMTQHDPQGEANEYTLTCGDTLSAQLGYLLRQQRLAEARKPIEPATQFIPYVGDLLLAPGESAPVTMQLANAAGKAMAVKGVNAVWGLMVNGVDQPDPTSLAGTFYLSNVVTVTDQAGQITATLTALVTATAADAAAPWAKIA